MIQIPNFNCKQIIFFQTAGVTENFFNFYLANGLSSDLV